MSQSERSALLLNRRRTMAAHEGNIDLSPIERLFQRRDLGLSLLRAQRERRGNLWGLHWRHGYVGLRHGRSAYAPVAQP
jgi:hypothetical protein